MHALFLSFCRYFAKLADARRAMSLSLVKCQEKKFLSAACPQDACTEAPFCVTMTVAIEFHSRALTRAHVRSRRHFANLPLQNSRGVVVHSCTVQKVCLHHSFVVHQPGWQCQASLRPSKSAKFSACLLDDAVNLRGQLQSIVHGEAKETIFRHFLLQGVGRKGQTEGTGWNTLWLQEHCLSFL